MLVLCPEVRFCRWCATSRSDVRRDAHVLPLSVGFNFREIILFHEMDCVTAEQQPERWIVQARDVENSGSRFRGITGLLAVIVALEAGCLSHGGVLLETPFAQRPLRSSEVA